MKRESPAAFMQFEDHRMVCRHRIRDARVAMAISLKLERSRFGLSLLAIKQNEPAAEAAGINTLTWKLRAIMVIGGDRGGHRRFLCGGAVDRDATERVRHAHLGAGAHRDVVRWRGDRVGAGRWFGDPDSACRIAARRAWRQDSGHPGRGVRHRDRARHSARTGRHRSPPTRGVAATAWRACRKFPCNGGLGRRHQPPRRQVTRIAR